MNTRQELEIMEKRIELQNRIIELTKELVIRQAEVEEECRWLGI
jgi:hypothetical protein